MSKEKKQLPNNSKDVEELDINGNPIDPKKKYIGNKVKIPMASPNHPVYKTSATIIIGGRPVTTEHKKKEKFLEFLSRAPISFDKGDES